MSDLPRPDEVKVEPLSYKELAKRYSALKAKLSKMEEAARVAVDDWEHDSDSGMHELKEALAGGEEA